MKKLLFTITAVCLLALAACRTADMPSVVKLKGETMGTYYEITYITPAGYVNMQNAIDSLLEAFNQSVSTYIPSSIISTLNKANAGDTVPVDPFFAKVFTTAKEVYNNTGGAFDPSVMPLVNAWGFGYKKNQPTPDSLTIDSLRRLVDFPSFTLLANPPRVVKTKQNTELDFSAIAKGYGVDVVAQLLENNGINRYLVDIGGELSAKGLNAQNNVWTVAIDQPADSASLNNRQAAAVTLLRNRSVATSGNYRNFHVKDGVKYAHTIDPKTGYTKMSDLLSASVFHQNCMTADAYATAFMVMGYQNARKLVEANPNLDALFIYSNDKGEIITYRTPGVEVNQ